MEITGILKEKYNSQNGTSVDKTWTCQSFLIETEGNYPDSLVLKAFNDQHEKLNTIMIGAKLKVKFSSKVSTTRGKTGEPFNNLKAYKIENLSLSPIAQPQPETKQVEEETFITEPEKDGDLPF